MRAVLLFAEASLLKEPRDESGFTFRRRSLLKEPRDENGLTFRGGRSPKGAL